MAVHNTRQADDAQPETYSRSSVLVKTLGTRTAGDRPRFNHKHPVHLRGYGPSAATGAVAVAHRERLIESASLAIGVLCPMWTFRPRR